MNVWLEREGGGVRELQRYWTSYIKQTTSPSHISYARLLYTFPQMLKESSIYGGPAILPAGKKQCYEAGTCVLWVIGVYGLC